jgi:2-aminoadipate transaminase
MDGLSGSAIREIFKLLRLPGMISFAGGNPAPEALEEAVITDVAQHVMSQDGKAILQYGPTEGYGPLRVRLCDWLRGFGFSPTTEEVLPITGSTQGIDLVCKALVDPGDAVLVENPTFLGALQTLRLYQANIVPVVSDENGIIVQALEEAMRKYRPKLLYIIPTFQNPTGVTLAEDRRAPIAALAEKYGVLVLEDDPYRDLRYAGRPMPAIKGYDQAGWVAHLSSFSKTIAPGLRCGALSADEGLIRKLAICKQSVDVHTSTLTQAVVSEYLARRLLPGHLADIRKLYAARLAAMLEALAAWPEGTRYTTPLGGLFVWVRLPGGMDASELLSRAVEKGVAFVPGSHFYCQDAQADTLRLNFSNSEPDKIRRGMAVLQELIREMPG